MNEAEVAIGGFIISGGEVRGIFELAEAPFNHVAQGINGRIDGQLDLAIALCRYRCRSTTSFHIFTNKVSILAFVGK